MSTEPLALPRNTALVLTDNVGVVLKAETKDGLCLWDHAVHYQGKNTAPHVLYRTQAKHHLPLQTLLSDAYNHLFFWFVDPIFYDVRDQVLTDLTRAMSTVFTCNPETLLRPLTVSQLNEDGYTHTVIVRLYNPQTDQFTSIRTVIDDPQWETYRDRMITTEGLETTLQQTPSWVEPLSFKTP